MKIGLKYSVVCQILFFVTLSISKSESSGYFGLIEKNRLKLQKTKRKIQNSILKSTFYHPQREEGKQKENQRISEFGKTNQHRELRGQKFKKFHYKSFQSKSSFHQTTKQVFSNKQNFIKLPKLRNLQANTTQTKNQTQFIVNGNFSKTACKVGRTCTWSSANFKSNYLEGWLPDPDIEIGWVSLYRKQKDQYFIIELASWRATCIRQYLSNLPDGFYELNYHFATRNKISLNFSKMDVYFGGRLIDERWAGDYSWQNVTVSNIVVQGENGLNLSSGYLRVCGDERLGGVGNLVKYVSFKRVKDLSITTVNATTNITVTTNATSNSTVSTKTTTNATLVTNTITNATQTTDTTAIPPNASAITNKNGNSSANSTVSTQTNSLLATDGTTSSSTSVITNSSASIITNSSNILTSNSTDFQSMNWTQIYEETHVPNLNQAQNTTSPNSSVDSIPNSTANSTTNSTQDLLITDPPVENSTIPKYVQQTLNTFSSNQFLGTIFLSPIIRKTFVKGFAYIINIDHLWLYIYHQKSHKIQLDTVLNWINKFQQTKWNILHTDYQNSFLSFSLIQQTLNIKIDQTPCVFYQIQQNTRQFFYFSYKFFLLNLPFCILFIFICKLLHHLLQKNTHIFSQFSQNSFLFLIILQGNTEPFTYYLISDIQNLFSQNAFMKSLDILSLISFFTLIFLLISLPYLLPYLYKNKEFYDKCKNTLKGSVYFMVDFGLFNILLGSIHVLAEKSYTTQLTLLLFVQSAFNIYTIVCLKQKKPLLTDKFMTCQMMWGSFIRIILILTLFYYESAPKDVWPTIDLLHQNLIIFYLLLLALSIFFFFVEILSKFFVKMLNLLKKIFPNEEKDKNLVINSSCNLDGTRILQKYKTYRIKIENILKQDNELTIKYTYKMRKNELEIFNESRKRQVSLIPDYLQQKRVSGLRENSLFRKRNLLEKAKTAGQMKKSSELIIPQFPSSRMDLNSLMVQNDGFVFLRPFSSTNVCLTQKSNRSLSSAKKIKKSCYLETRKVLAEHNIKSIQSIEYNEVDMQ